MTRYPGLPDDPRGLMVVDVDGTLLTDDGHVTGRVRDALIRSVDAGWVIAMATGRTYEAAMQARDGLSFIRYCALSNGSIIVDVEESRILRAELIDPEAARTVIGVVREYGAVPAVYTSDIMNQLIRYDTTEGMGTYFARYVESDPRCRRVGDVLALAGDAAQIASMAERDTVFAIRAELERLPVTVVTVPYESASIGGKDHSYWFLQVVAHNATKQSAVRWMAERFGIPAGRTVAVGDNYNDADMIAGADVGVAMGNAPDEIKALAREIVATNGDSGLAEVVERILLNDGYFARRN